MEYLSVHDMSKKWNIKERHLTAYCRDNRIAGARKIGKEWMIPSDAIKPIDKRTKEFEEYKLEIEKNNTTIPYTESNSEDKVIKSFINKIIKNEKKGSPKRPYNSPEKIRSS